MPNITFSEASNLNGSIYGECQAPLRKAIMKRGESFEQQSVLPKLFAMETSNHFAEMTTSFTAMEGFMPVGENGAYPVDGMEEGYQKLHRHMTWKDSFSLTKEIIEDSKLTDLRKKPMNFVTGFYRTREKYGAALYGGAIQGSTSVSFGGKSFDITTADGKSLFATDHPAKVKGADQTNKFADAFSKDALGALETHMQNTRGDNDEILDVSPDTILIPNIYRLKNAVFEAIGSDKDPETANNGYNFQFGNWTVIVWNYLNQFITANTYPWVLLDSRYNAEYSGAVWYDRTKLEVRSTVDENTDANVWRGRARFVAGFADWRFAAVGGVAGGSSL